jgi:stage III sporulation protein AG
MTEETLSTIKDKISLVAKKIKSNKITLVLILAGVLLLILPSNNKSETEINVAEQDEIFTYDAAEQEKKLEKILSEISGAGKVKVMLSFKSSPEKILASDRQDEISTGEKEKETTVNKKTVIISESNSKDTAVTIKYVYPECIGAVIVAEGADKAGVMLALTEATAAATGLSSNKIKVVKMK